MRKLTFLALSLSLSAASATTTYGPVENFDVINDTGKTAYGFEVKLYGIQPGDITSMFGDPSRFGTMVVERYLAPIVTLESDAKGSYTAVRYKAVWDGTNWSTFTPTGTLQNPPVDSCWPFGDPNYNVTFPNSTVPNYPCDHFGISSSVQATTVEYNWLLDGGNGTFVGVPSNVPAPNFSNNAQGQLVVKVAPPPKPQVIDNVVVDFGVPQWAKVTGTGYGYNVAPEDLVAGNQAIKLADQPKNVQVEWQLIQHDIGNPDPNNGSVDFTGVQPDPGAKSIIYNIEFYEYTGAVKSDGQAQPLTSDTPAQPDPKDLGPWKVNQMIAVNLDGQLPAAPVAPVAPTISASFPDGTVGTSYPTQTVNVSANANDTFTVAVTGLPPGLTFDSATNTVSPAGNDVPTTTGNYTVHVVATDVTNGTTTTADVPVVIHDAVIVFTDATLGQGATGGSYSDAVVANGGQAPFSYSADPTLLPTGLTLNSDGTITGTPTQSGKFTFSVTATDAAGVSAAANATIVIVDPVIACSGTNELINNLSPRGGWYSTTTGPNRVNYMGATTTYANGVNTFNIGYVTTYAGSLDPTKVFCNAKTQEISLPLNVTTGTFTTGTVGTPYTPVAITVKGGWSPYAISVSQLPPGLSYSNGSVSGTPTTAGTYPIGISVRDSKMNPFDITTITITINPKPDFNLTSVSSLSVKRGYSVSGNVKISPVNGFTGTVSLSTIGLHPNTTATFGAITNGSSLMTIKTNSKTLRETYQFTIRATSGALVHDVPVTLTVN